MEIDVRIRSAYLLPLAMLMGCAALSPGSIMSVDSVAQLAGESKETVEVRREPSVGGRLKIAGVPLSSFESSMTRDSGSINMKAMLEQFEYCKITADSAGLTRMKLAGRIVSVDDDSIVLSDAIAIDEATARTTGVSTMEKMPYVSRLFKKNGTLFQPIPIPGEVHLALRNVHEVENIDAANWPSFQQSGFQRVGIDFDFNISPSH